jgi:hypothetical protein
MGQKSLSYKGFSTIFGGVDLKSMSPTGAVFPAG